MSWIKIRDFFQIQINLSILFDNRLNIYQYLEQKYMAEINELITTNNLKSIQKSSFWNSFSTTSTFL